MSTSKKAKTSSKNNPTHRQKSRQKIYNDKLIKPVRYIDRDLRVDYISAEYVNGSLVHDKSGNPIKWEAI